MTEFHQDGRELLLDAFLDGTMSEADRAAWLIRLREDARLRAQVARQEAIDAAVRGLYAPGDERQAQCMARLQSAVTGEAAERHIHDPAPTVVPAVKPNVKRNRRSSVLALAATVGLCVLAGWQVKEFLFPAVQPFVYPVQKWRSLDRVYADEMAGGFKPAWVCTNDAEFAKATRRELGQAVVLAQIPGLSTLGWSYANTLSTNTLYLLALANDAKVLIFMTPADNTKEPVVEPESGLCLHERTLGQVKLYEVSPQPEPLLVQHFYEPAP